MLHFSSRNPEGVAATAVAAMKGGKVVGIVVTDGGSGYAEASASSTSSFVIVCL